MLLKRSTPALRIASIFAIVIGVQTTSAQQQQQPRDGTADDLERLQWVDANRSGKNDFQPWTKTTHPTLGDGVDRRTLEVR